MEDCVVSSGNKIEGLDKWDVESNARTLIDAKKIENGDKKMYTVVLKEVKKQADAAMEAAAQKNLAAEEISLLAKTKKRMGKVFGKGKK
jgi:hypothetical protein